MNKNQSGFHHVLLPLLIVVVAVIGFVGWRVFHSKNQLSNPTNNSQPTLIKASATNNSSSGRQPIVYTIDTFNPAAVPPITANPVDITHIFAISLFRSDQGHDYSQGAWDGETCRSMKHYFDWSQNMVNGVPVRSTPGPGESNINIYSPFDGTITANDTEQVNIGTQVHIASAKNPAYYVRLFHIDLLSSLKVGSKVKSGQLVGTIGPKDGTDVSYEALMPGGRVVYLSIFDYMAPQAFAPYAALGRKPSDFVLTQEQANAKNYKCDVNGQFIRSADYQTSTSGDIEGYVSLRPNPYQ